MSSLVLEKTCPLCNGDGGNDAVTVLLDTPYWAECEDCKGTGKVPSEDGKAILEFLRTYNNE